MFLCTFCGNVCCRFPDDSCFWALIDHCRFDRSVRVVGGLQILHIIIGILFYQQSAGDQSSKSKDYAILYIGFSTLFLMACCIGYILYIQMLDVMIY
jgi:hypothetical protein